MGEDLANNIFGSGGEGEGMASNGNITLNGDNITLSVAQTIVNHIDVILHNKEDNNLNLFVRRSFSEDLWLWLNDSARFI